MPLCKAWGIWTNSRSLALALEGPHVRCSGGHPSVAVGGADTEHSGSYPDNLALFILSSITSSVDEVEAMVELQRWPCNLGSPPIPDGAGDGRVDDQLGLTPAGTGTDGARRCRKPAAFSKSVGGAVQR